MRVLLTGATGFIGSHLVTELVAAGHEVIGLARSSAGVRAVAEAGAEPLLGDVNDIDLLARAAEGVASVIHTAFDHDPVDQKRSSEADRRVIAALGRALASDRLLIVTSGTGLVRAKNGAPAAEADDHLSCAEFPRAATEEAADALIAAGSRVTVVRLPQVHDVHRQGRISWHIGLARKKGYVAYIGDGLNRVPAVHVSDAVRLYRLALESDKAPARLHAVAEDGVAMRDVAGAIGARLGLPVVELPPEMAHEYFGWMASLAAADLSASGAWTRAALGWHPTGPDLLADLHALQLSP